jgi:PHD finger-like domain-containing protein 5A
MSARHHPDLVMCRKQPGTSVGKLCERCEGKCVVCDSYVRPHTAVRLCAECDFGTFAGRCTICGGPGVSDAYYCKECVQQEKDVRGRGAAAGQAARSGSTGLEGHRAIASLTFLHPTPLITCPHPPRCRGTAAPRSSTWALPRQTSTLPPRSLAPRFGEGLELGAWHSAQPCEFTADAQSLLQSYICMMSVF